jgi:hypothetical protein
MVKYDNCTVQIDGLDGFKRWLTSHKEISETTACRYVKILSGLVPLNTTHKSSAAPEDFVEYGRWRFLAFRSYIHYRYQMGLLSMEDRARWMELLKFEKEKKSWAERFEGLAAEMMDLRKEVVKK